MRLDVPDMDCPSCATKVENAVATVDGITGIDPRPTTGTLVVGYDPERTDRRAVVAAVESAGYDVVDGDDEVSKAVWLTPRGIKTAISGAMVALALLVWFVLPNPELGTVLGSTYFVSDLFLAGAVAAGGQVILRNGFYSARNRSLDIDFLMSAAILAATVLTVAVPGENLLIEAASLAFLFNVAELLERHSIERTRRSLDELLELAPDTAVVRRDGERVEVPAEDVRVGEVVTANASRFRPRTYASARSSSSNPARRSRSMDSSATARARSTRHPSPASRSRSTSCVATRSTRGRSTNRASSRSRRPLGPTSRRSHASSTS
jgi:Cd2+/Zn2+-exporting ATPase